MRTHRLLCLAPLVTMVIVTGPSALLAQAPVRPSAANAEELMATYSEQALAELNEEGVALVASKDQEGLIEGLVIFEKPLAYVWELLIQGDRQDEYRPELKGIEAIAAGDGWSTDEHQLKMMFIKISYTLRYEYRPDAHHIRWALDPEFDNGLEHISGYWWLYETADGRTLGLFGTAVRVGAGLPGWLQDGITRKNVPETLERCRKWVNSGGEERA